jgi:hypothetical protein
MEASSVTTKLIRDLDERYGSIEPAEALKEAILIKLKEREPQTVDLAHHKFALKGATFQIIVSYRDILKPGTLAIVIIEEGEAHKPIRARTAIAGIGQYDKADVLISPKLSQHLEMFAELTRGIYEVGYSWLNEFLFSKARELESSFIIEMHRVIRLVFAGKIALADLVRLGVVDKDKGLYLFDQRTTERTIRSIAGARSTVRQSPAALFLGVLTGSIPFDKMVARHAIPTGECLRFEFSELEYRDESVFGLAEQIMLKSPDSRAASVFPIIRDEQPYLLAAFPTSHEQEISSTLQAHLSEIREVFNNHKSYVRALVNKVTSLSKGGLPLGPVGEFVGGVFKAMAGG